MFAFLFKEYNAFVQTIGICCICFFKVKLKYLFSYECLCFTTRKSNPIFYL